MKTELTKRIENSLRTYDPAEMGECRINKFRYRHIAFEVPAICGTTEGGIVDCVSIAEYFGDMERRHVCQCRSWKKDGIRRIPMNCPLGIPNSDAAPEFCDESSCHWNAIREIGKQKILVVCYEIKVTVADFKSTHGHNFVGNLNYYVVPKEIYQSIEPLVPEGIGIVAFIQTDKMTGFRRKRDATFKEMPDEDQKWMLLSVLKRIRDDHNEEIWDLKHKKSEKETLLWDE